MFTRKIIFNKCLVLAIVCIPSYILAQPKITGPSYVRSGVTYQYIIDGSWDAGNMLQVCINKGHLRGSQDRKNCSGEISPVNFILVEWTDSATGKPSISVTSSKGNSTLDVTFITPLVPGKIDSFSKAQVIKYGAIPAAISCLPDSGGAFSPLYSYQWQKSNDHVFWQDIPGAIDSSLKIEEALTQHVYYRRKVTEAVSGSIGYSDGASVFVEVPQESKADK